MLHCSTENNTVHFLLNLLCNSRFIVDNLELAKNSGLLLRHLIIRNTFLNHRIHEL